jgi:hypothetical protein
MQQNLGFSPLTTGLAFLPMTVLTVLSSTIAQTRTLPRTGAKPLITVGMALGVVAMVLLTRLGPGSGYAAGVLPSLIVLGLGLGMIFAPAIGTATHGNLSDAGVASAMVNTSQQIGGSVGTALLSTLFASSASAFARTHAGVHGLQAAAQVHGYTTGVLVVRRDFRCRAADRGCRVPDARQADGAGAGRRVRRRGRAGPRHRVDGAAGTAVVRPAQPVELPA